MPKPSTPSRPALQSRIDRIAAQVLEANRRPLRLRRRRPARQARLHPRLRHRAPGHRLRSRRPRHARDALLHRLHLQAIHRRRHPPASGAGQALPRRSRRQIHSRPHARQRSHHPPDSLPHLRLSGLLARGLRDDPHAPARNRAADPRHLGQKAARLRSRHPMAILQHQLRHRRPHRRDRHRRAALRLPHRAHLPPARHDLRLELRRKPAHPGRRHGLLSPRARSAAPRAQGGPRLDVRRRRAGHDRARPGPLGREPDRPIDSQARELQTDVH